MEVEITELLKCLEATDIEFPKDIVAEVKEGRAILEGK